jgi:diguanylate cyclase
MLGAHETIERLFEPAMVRVPRNRNDPWGRSDAERDQPRDAKALPAVPARRPAAPVGHEAGQARGRRRGGSRNPGNTAVSQATRNAPNAARLADVRVDALHLLLCASLARIEHLQQALERSRCSAQRDSLTGLAVRGRFDTSLRDAMRHAQSRSGALGLLILDIDHFKHVNDTYGHLVGDDVLRVVARLVADEVGEAGLAARIGGEEFAVILPDMSLPQSTALAQRIRQAVVRRTVIERGTGKQLGPVTCSIGAAGYRPGESADDLFDRCDATMYRAKRGGRNRVEAETPATEPTVA